MPSFSLTGAQEDNLLYFLLSFVQFTWDKSRFALDYK